MNCDIAKSWVDDAINEALINQQHTLHQELQKARHDWLREEIVRLEGMNKPTPTTHVCNDIGVTFVSDITGKEICVHWAFIEEYNQALQTIIDRYHSELNQPSYSEMPNN